MFPTAVVFFSVLIAAFQTPEGWLNWTIKIGAGFLAGWASIYAAAYWGVSL